MCRLLSASLLLCLISVTLASAASDWQCTTPTFSNGPLPPVLPDSYYMAFEVIDVIGKKRHASEVWYDWQSQRARVRSVDETGVRRELVVFYNFDYAFQYVETKPDSPVEDANRVFTCEFFDLSSRKNTPFVEKDDQPLKMVDVYQSLLFGGKYPYAFVSRTADRESRFIDTNKFSTCITDWITGRRLNVTYLWTRDGERPIRFEIDGGLPNSDGEPELRVHQVASVIRFERDPKMDVELFTVPRDIHCRNDPRTGTNNFPLLSPDFTWREEVLNYARDDNNVLLRDQTTLRHRELWSSEIFRLARMDWTPTAEDGKTFEPFIGKAISVIADVDYRALFIVQTNTGQCKIVPLNKDFTLVNEGENDSFFLREPLELLGMTKEHVNKGEHFERGSRVSVYTRLDDVDSATGTITIHEMSFRVDQALLNRTNGAYGFVPLSQVSRKLLPTPDEKTRAYEKTEQISYFKVQSDYVHLEKFEAPACIAHHKRRMFQIGFKTDFKDVIYGNGYEFLNRLRDIIARTGNLGTIMRVQKLEIFEDHVQDRIFVKMVLLEPLPEIVGAINTTVDEARDAIVEALDNYQLAVPIEWEGTSNTIVPEAGSFVEIGQVQIEPFHPRLLRAEMFSARIEVTSKYFSSVNLAVMCVCVFLVGVTAGFSGLALRRTLVRK